MIFTIPTILLLAAAFVLLLNLTPEQIAGDLSRLITPEPSLRDKVRTAQGKKKAGKLAAAFVRVRSAMADTGKGGRFAMVCAVSLFAALGGGLFAVLIGNLFLVPVLAVAMAGVPFLYIQSTLASYDKHIEREMETALSIVTTSFVRTEDIVVAVRENLKYIKPPIQAVFQGFITQATLISADTRAALVSLSGKIDNAIYREWCECLVRCQDDRTLKNSLLPIVGKLSDVRLVNTELHTTVAEPKKEYWMMVAMVVGNIPLLYMLNADWFRTLMFTLPGQAVLAVCGIAIIITAVLMLKYTMPLEYKR